MLSASVILVVAALVAAILAAIELFRNRESLIAWAVLVLAGAIAYIAVK